MTRAQTTAFVLIATVALILGLTVNKMLSEPQGPDRATLLNAGIVLLPQPRALPALELTDQDGQPVSTTQLQDRWNLLFFGYTYCPDICPTTLVQLRQLQNKLPEDSKDRIRLTMISVDPHRDSPEQLKTYLNYFDPSFQGWTADLAIVQQLSNTVGIPFVPGDTGKEYYTVDHSGNLAIIGPDGKQQGYIRAPLDIDRLAAVLPELVMP